MAGQLFQLSKQLRKRGFVKAQSDLGAARNDGPPDQIRFLGHPLQRLGARRRILLHLQRPVEFVPGIQEIEVIAFPNQGVQLIDGQWIFARSRSSKSAFFASKRPLALRQVVQVGLRYIISLGMGFSRRGTARRALFQYRGTFGSISADQRSIPPARLWASTDFDRSQSATFILRMPWWQ